MSPKSLFIVILRIIGLLLLFQSIIAVPLIFEQFYVSIQSITELFDKNESVGLIIQLVVTSIITVLIYILLIKYLLIKPELIIDKLKLDKNFDEEIFELNIHSSTVIRIAVIVIGGMTFIEYFIPFLRNIHTYLFTDNDSGFLGMNGKKTVSGLDLIAGGLSILISYVLLTNSRRLTNWIEQLRRK